MMLCLLREFQGNRKNNLKHLLVSWFLFSLLFKIKLIFINPVHLDCPMCNNTVKIVNLGEDIHCSATSNPVANYIWTDGSGSRLSSTSALSADKVKIGSQYLCTVCSACLTGSSNFCCNQTFEGESLLVNSIR